MKRNRSKLIYGWGVNDLDSMVHEHIVIGGVKKRIPNPYYEDWMKVLQRCLSKLLQDKQPTYKNCTIHEDWKYLSNFIKWVDTQPNKDWQNCQLDKDFLVEGNKHYGPDTCVYITGELNKFITNRYKLRGDSMIGVSIKTDSKINPYEARCKNPFTLKLDYLGLFPTELEAHKAWQAKKHEYACQLADLQEDKRVAKRLREMYSPDKDWTNR